MRLFFLMTILTLTLVGTAYTSDDGGVTSPFDFGFGSRELSLGGSGFSMADATTAAVWNPSRLARTERFAVSTFHSRLYTSEVSYQYLGISIPTMDYGGFGIGIARHAVSDIEKRDASNIYLGEIDFSQIGLYFGYGRTLSDIDFGIALSLEHHSLDTYKATSSPGLDISLSRSWSPDSRLLRDINVSLNAKNLIRPGITLDEEKYEYSRGLLAGATMAIMPIGDWRHYATLSAGARVTQNAGTELAVGLEYSVDDLLFLRGGMRDQFASGGIGINWQGVQFDYGMVDRDLGSIHTFTLSLAYGKPVTLRREERARRREAEFVDQVNSKLTEKNRTMMENLIAEGRKMMASGRLEEAVSDFDRAMFLARSIGSDTTRLAEIANEARDRLDETNRKMKYVRFLELAQTNYQTGDMLAARYFAGLALEELPDSREATDIFEKADSRLGAMAAAEDMIAAKLSRADSLAEAGNTEGAESILLSLKEFAPENDGVHLRLARLEISKWRKRAEDASALQASTAKLDDAVVEPDTGDELVPDSTLPPGAIADPVEYVGSKMTVDPELLKGAEASYEESKEYFRLGDLTRAIAGWELVQSISPGYKMTEQYLVSAYKFVGMEAYGKKHREEAIAVWEKAMALKDDPEVADYINRARNEMQKLKELASEQ